MSVKWRGNSPRVEVTPGCGWYLYALILGLLCWCLIFAMVGVMVWGLGNV